MDLLTDKEYLLACLDGTEGDHVTQAALADYYEERGDPLAEMWRYLAEHKRRPGGRETVPTLTVHYKWCWVGSACPEESEYPNRLPMFWAQYCRDWYPRGVSWVEHESIIDSYLSVQDGWLEWCKAGFASYL